MNSEGYPYEDIEFEHFLPPEILIMKFGILIYMYIYIIIHSWVCKRGKRYNIITMSHEGDF